MMIPDVLGLHLAKIGFIIPGLSLDRVPLIVGPARSCAQPLDLCGLGDDVKFWGLLLNAISDMGFLYVVGSLFGNECQILYIRTP